MKPLEDHHREAAAMLGQGATQAEAAEAVGRTVRTVRDWMRREDFRALVDESRGREASHEPGALATLRELLKSPDEAIRLRAAIELVRTGRGGRDPAEDEEAPRLEVFSDALDGPEPPPGRVDIAALYEAWDGKISQREADYWRTELGCGWAD